MVADVSNVVEHADDPRTTAATATTVYTPRGTTAELLRAIAAEVGSLSEKLIDNDGQGAALERIQAQWEAVRPTIETDHPELLGGFVATMDQVERAVDRRRPADADKAARSLGTLIDAAER